MITHTLSVAKSSGYDVVVVDEKKQTGNTFGQRLSNAFKTVFAQGYTHVIAIGNDSAALSGNHIRQAANKLDSDSMVLGPSRDGGVYLIGLCEDHFDENIFRSLPWESSRVYTSLKNYGVRRNITVHRLQPLTDFDSPCDLKTVLKELAALGLTGRLIFIFLNGFILSGKPGNATFDRTEPLFLHTDYALRAPPVV